MADVAKAVSAAKAAFAADEAKRATRVWSQLALEKIVPVLPELIGGSADLTGSNGTRTKDHLPVGRGSFAPEDWEEALTELRSSPRPLVEELMGEPMLGDLLADGLAAFGHRCDD